jgi:hypothetical protein
MKIHRPDRLTKAWRELEEAGIPLEPEALRASVARNCGLTMKQMPNYDDEAVIRELKNGRVAYALPLFIRREEGGKTIVRGLTLHVPWDDSVEWLDEDRKLNRGWYAFLREDPPRHEHARDSVLNHRIICTLARGDIREGLLLAVGKVRPPASYEDRELIPIRFSILDQWDREPSLTFGLRLVRRQHLEERRVERRRGPLFSRRDPEPYVPRSLKAPTEPLMESWDETRINEEILRAVHSAGPSHRIHGRPPEQKKER